MRVLYLVFDDPVTEHGTGGGSSVYFSHLMEMAHAGWKVTLVYIGADEKLENISSHHMKHPQEWDAIEDAIAEVRYVKLRKPVKGLKPSATSFVHRLLRGYRFKMPVHHFGAWAVLRQWWRTGEFDFMYAQHRLPAVLAANIAPAKTVYAHHDWQYKIAALKSGKPENKPLRRLEERIVRSVKGVVTGSATEREEIIKLGQPHTFYIPTTSTLAPAANLGFDEAQLPRIIHLDSFSATANRVGVEWFADNVYPHIRQLDIPTVFAGSTKGLDDKLRQKLAPFLLPGYVANLSEILRPGDIHIMPYPYDTGQRTRIALALAYGQVIVAHSKAIAGCAELVHGHNCLKGNTGEEIANHIVRLANSPADRRRLITKAVETCSAHFLIGRQRKAFESLSHLFKPQFPMHG